MGNTTNYLLPYPESADAADAPTQMRALAVATDTQLKSVNDRVGAALPTPAAVISPNTNAVPGGYNAWANLTTRVKVDITLTAPALVQVTFGAWMASDGTGDLRMSVNLTGATVEAPPGSSYGEVPRITSPQNDHKYAARFSTFNAGVTHVELQAYKTGAITDASINYAVLRVIPIRWM